MEDLLEQSFRNRLASLQVEHNPDNNPHIALGVPVGVEHAEYARLYPVYKDGEHVAWYGFACVNEGADDEVNVLTYACEFAEVALAELHAEWAVMVAAGEVPRVGT